MREKLIPTSGVYIQSIAHSCTSSTSSSGSSGNGSDVCNRNNSSVPLREITGAVNYRRRSETV